MIIIPMFDSKNSTVRTTIISKPVDVGVVQVGYGDENLRVRVFSASFPRIQFLFLFFGVEGTAQDEACHVISVDRQHVVQIRHNLIHVNRFVNCSLSG